MGDFAAGKMLSAGLPERGEIVAADVAQCLKDLKSACESKAPALEAQLKAGAPAAEVDALGLHPHVAATLATHDGGFVIFEYTLFSCAQIIERSSEVSLPLRPIGKDIDDTLLVVNCSNGEVSTFEGGNTTAVASSFGAYLEKFRDAVISNKVQWAETSWVECS